MAKKKEVKNTTRPFLIRNMPEELRKELKHWCVENGSIMYRVAIRAIEEYLTRNPAQKRGKAAG